MLPVILGKCRPDKAKTQRWYIERQQYNFVIDDGTNMIKLTEEIDIRSMLQPGTRIIMRVITDEQADSMLTAMYIGKDMGTGYPPWVVGMGTYGYG